MDGTDLLLASLLIQDGRSTLKNLAQASGLSVSAVQARVRLILGMDLPPLVRIAQEHPDDAYRRALGIFTRDVWALGGSAAGLTDEAAFLAGAARLW